MTASRCVLKLSQLSLWELLPFLQVIVYNYYRCHRQGSRAASSSSQQQLAYSQQSNTTAYLTCSSCAFAQGKLGKKTKKWWENHNWRCVCVFVISHTRILLFNINKNLYVSLSLHLPFHPPCSSFPFIKNATNNNGKKISNVMGRIDGWMSSCIWLKTWCETQTGSPCCVLRY